MTLMPPLTGLNTPEVLSRLRLQDGSLLRHCQRIYKLEMQRLKWRHWNGAEGSTIAVGRSVLVDRIIEAVSDSGFREILGTGRQSAAAFRHVAWIALGEYGRLELAPYSPVDVLLLVKSHASHEVGSSLQATAREALGSLGFEIRVSVLTSKECLHRSQTQFPFAFACLAARHVAGDSGAFQDWSQRLWINLVKNQMVFLI